MGGGGYRGGYGGRSSSWVAALHSRAVAGAVIAAPSLAGYYGDQVIMAAGYYYGDAPAPAYYDNQYYIQCYRRGRARGRR